MSPQIFFIFQSVQFHWNHDFECQQNVYWFWMPTKCLFLAKKSKKRKCKPDQDIGCIACRESVASCLWTRCWWCFGCLARLGLMDHWTLIWMRLQWILFHFHACIIWSPVRLHSTHSLISRYRLAGPSSASFYTSWHQKISYLLRSCLYG